MLNENLDYLSSFLKLLFFYSDDLKNTPYRPPAIGSIMDQGPQLLCSETHSHASTESMLPEVLAQPKTECRWYTCQEEAFPGDTGLLKASSKASEDLTKPSLVCMGM